MSTSALVVIYRQTIAWPDTEAFDNRIKQYLCRSSTGLWLSDYGPGQWTTGPLSRARSTLMVVPLDERLTALFLMHEDGLMKRGWELGTEPAPPGSIAFTGVLLDRH